MRVYATDDFVERVEVNPSAFQGVVAVVGTHMVIGMPVNS
jgi:hypothetical protein